MSLFLDDQDFFEPLGEAAYAIGFEWPDHADFVQANADLRCQFVVDPEFAECLADVEVGLAGGDDSQAGRRSRVGTIDDHPVELVGAAIGQRRVQE
ncbi:MAG: hypothetical protein AW09_000381 [Candidatus Accumulibacter phosphatis]|uniref:Uncharacterized protein n=1 Tax=Candidatus Accumulibacter phosphatis TaxID=327160 RepID=A0A080M1Z2_9PROT|nr:MAG: hypothetical protein AW09_000381 [Candidatus Accumulibacter phosphatis]